MEFSRAEYWSGYPFHSPGDLPNPGIEPRSPTLQADSLPTELSGSYRKVLIIKKTGREKKDVKDSTKKQKIVHQREKMKINIGTLKPKCS